MPRPIWRLPRSLIAPAVGDGMTGVLVNDRGAATSVLRRGMHAMWHTDPKHRRQIKAQGLRKRGCLICGPTAPNAGHAAVCLGTQVIGAGTPSFYFEPCTAFSPARRSR